MLSPELLWFLAGLALVLLEFQLPGVIIIFFGLGAWITSLTTLLGWTEGLTSQIWTFSAGSVVLLIALRRFVKGRFLGHSSDPQQSDVNLDDFVGHHVRVIEAIEPGRVGRVEFRGSGWEAYSEGDRAIAVDDLVVIRRVDGIALVVDPADSHEPTGGSA